MQKSQKNNDIVFVCDVCGYDTNKWLGQCPNCKSWNSFFESKKKLSKNANNVTIKTPKTINDIKIEEIERIKTGFDEFDNFI